MAVSVDICQFWLFTKKCSQLLFVKNVAWDGALGVVSVYNR